MYESFAFDGNRHCRNRRWNILEIHPKVAIETKREGEKKWKIYPIRIAQFSWNYSFEREFFDSIWFDTYNNFNEVVSFPGCLVLPTHLESCKDFFWNLRTEIEKNQPKLLPMSIDIIHISTTVFFLEYFLVKRRYFWRNSIFSQQKTSNLNKIWFIWIVHKINKNMRIIHRKSMKYIKKSIISCILYTDLRKFSSFINGWSKWNQILFRWKNQHTAQANSPRRK